MNAKQNESDKSRDIQPPVLRGVTRTQNSELLLGHILRSSSQDVLHTAGSSGRNSFVELVASEPLVFSDHFLSSSAWCGCHFQQVCRYTDATATVHSQGAGQGRCERADVSRCAGLTDLCSREHLCIGNSVVATPSE